MQLFTESIIVQWQNIIYMTEAGIKDSFMKKTMYLNQITNNKFTQVY